MYGVQFNLIRILFGAISNIEDRELTNMKNRITLILKTNPQKVE